MKEDFLYYVWKYHLYDRSFLRTIQGDLIEVIKKGRKNDISGPDFLEAEIKINKLIWVGNVEIHVKSSDWNLHNHQYDKAYNNVVLHVVFEYDKEIYNQRGKPIPTLELKKRIKSYVWDNYQKFTHSRYDFIPCERSLYHFKDELVKNHLKTRLLIERFECKTQLIQEELAKAKNDWEAVLFIILARCFGTRVNRDAMEFLAKSFNFRILKKCQEKKELLEALLLGQAGFLEDQQGDAYFNRLQSEYKFLQSKFELKPCEASNFKFYGIRPSNYSTIRIAQLASLYYVCQNLFSFLMKIKRVKNLYSLFDVEVSDYWNSHYHFGKKSTRVFKRRFSQSFVDLIIINVVLPIQYCYGRQRGKDSIEVVEKILCEMRFENNSVTQNFKNLNLESKSAWDSQALIQLKTVYCNQKKCLNCEIGNKLIRKKG
ncbi:MAG: DUF2851 family protein [Flavobacteriales bacterium]